MKISVKNMVCHHCVEALHQGLASLGLNVREVRLGEAEIAEPQLTGAQLESLDRKLTELGFERILDQDEKLVEEVKQAVLHHVRSESECRLKLSACIERHVGVSYDTLSRLFSVREGRTIEKYQIAQKIELAKELLGYKELSLGEIADRMGYSSTAHLSRQFKDVTGMTPTAYLSLRENMRKGLSEV